MCWFLITGILLILSFIAMWFFPLHGKEWDKAKHDLSIKHMEKQKEYEEKILAQKEATEAK